jgi:hypothetical protein
MFNFPYKIIKSRRKSLHLSINKDDIIIVKSPYFVTQKQINTFIESNLKWINKILLEKNKVKEKRLIKHNGTLPFLGEEYKIKFTDQEKDLFLENYFYFNKNNSQNALTIFSNWYKQEAKLLFSEQVNIYSYLMNVNYNKLRLSQANSYWGSCNNKQYLNINWRLIMAPIDIINYIIIHELAHLKYLNHSKDFWKFVAKFQPNYKQHDRWLKVNGKYLQIFS